MLPMVGGNLKIACSWSPHPIVSPLHCWVPVLFSYTNGASALHFKHHFLTLFRSIALQAESKMVAVKDHLFAGVSTKCSHGLPLASLHTIYFRIQVMDFSDAERNGFIEGLDPPLLLAVSVPSLTPILWIHYGVIKQKDEKFRYVLLITQS